MNEEMTFVGLDDPMNFECGSQNSCFNECGRDLNQILYDLDEFRFRIFEQGLLDEFNLEPSVLDRIRENDEALLDLGIHWVKNMVFDVEFTFSG